MLLVAIAMGTADALALLGWPVIDPLNLDWLKGDPAAHYLGWAFYRQEPEWRVPVTWMTGLGHPVGVSVAYQDSIPILAVPLRLLGPFLPDPFQYLGLYATLSLVLQAYFGLLLCRRLCHANLLFTYAGGFLLLLSPVLIYRLHGHFPLGSQWLLLASLLAYFRVTPTRARARSLTPFFLLLAVVGAIHPYLSLMCLLIALAAAARVITFDRASWLRVLATCALLAITLAASLAFFGFLGGVEWSAQSAGGYGEFSLNLLGPFNSVGLATFLPALPVRPLQIFEGYSYLGAGPLFLILLHVAFRRRGMVSMLSRAHLPTLGLALACLVLALSTTVTLGPFTLLRLHLPVALELGPAAFRSSGRLFWPTYYLIVLAALVVLFRLWTPPLRGLLLALAVLLQLADLPPLYAHIRARHQSRVEDPLRSPRWRELGGGHARLLVIPPWICPGTPGGEDSYRFFGLLAASQHMETNTYYPARPAARALHEHCATIPRMVMAGVLDPHAAYVVNAAVLAGLRAHDPGTHRCQTVDGFHLCTRIPGAVAGRSRRAPAASYRPGDTIAFTEAGQAAPYLLYGWSPPEPEGTWTEGAEAALAMRLDPPRAGPLEMVSVVTPFLGKGHRRLQVDVMANGRTVAEWHFSGRPRTTTERARLDELPGRDGSLVLGFRIRAPRSPASLGLSDDHRALGLFIRSLSIAPPAPREPARPSGCVP